MAHFKLFYTNELRLLNRSRMEKVCKKEDAGCQENLKDNPGD